MQVNSSAAATDPAITNAIVQNNIDAALAVRAKQVDKQQGEAIVAMVQAATEVNAQLAEGRLDIRL